MKAQSGFQSRTVVFEDNRPIQDPGGLYSEGIIIFGFVLFHIWGAYIWRGLYREGLIFGTVTVVPVLYCLHGRTCAHR